VPTTSAKRGVYSELDADVITQLAALSQDPRFQLLRKVYEQRRQELSVQLGRQQLQFGPPADQRRADFRAGFWAGIHAILHAPASAEAALEGALKQERINRLVDD